MFSTVVATAASMDGLNRLFSNDNSFLRALRDLGLRATNQLSGVKQMFAREAAGQTGSLPRLLRAAALVSLLAQVSASREASANPRPIAGSSLAGKKVSAPKAGKPKGDPKGGKPARKAGHKAKAAPKKRAAKKAAPKKKGGK